MRVRQLGCIVLITFVWTSAVAQHPRLKAIQSIESTYNSHQASAEQRIQHFLQKQKAARSVKTIDGSTMILVDVTPNGIPVYEKTFNNEVAASLSVVELRSGGSLGLLLEGTGIQVGIWDGGKVRNDHVELTGRVTQTDNAPTFDSHATHVLGTIMASGVNPNAKGMAPKATAIAFDFNNDVSEMTSQAKPDQTSIILSNHSYGTVSGWDAGTGSWVWHGDPSISNTIDWKFGFYDSKSNFYDAIAFNAPYYLIVKSAGNDQSDEGDGSRPQDCNPFDCIPTNGVAKNILTVGAVKKLAGVYSSPSDVEITDFTSFGPTDDGRIKPDIVAPGQAVFSSDADATNDYATFSGTSMSSPATTGTLALLQELYKSLHSGNLMQAATLKALVLHTAREAGTDPGPDYKFGWGLLNAEAAAKLIIGKDDQNIFIEEQTLTQGQVFELTLSPKENTKMTATLVWTDPAGTPPSPSLNPTTRMLVNDLDLRLVDDGGTEQFPWVLNPSNPSAAATKGDNTRDNVEKIEFNLPEPRTYKLRVSHEGTLMNGSQNFALIVEYTSLIDPRVSYYWIGNTGDWDDGNNWSLANGGAPAGSVPDESNNVIFDENSFSGNNQTVSLTQDEECYLIRWFAKEDINLSLNGHTLTLNGELNLLSDNISTTTSGTLSMQTEGEVVVNLNNNALDDLTIQFSGANATWDVSGDFSLDAIEIVEGTVNIQDNAFKVNSIFSSGIGSKALVLSNTNFEGVTSLTMDISSIDLAADNATLDVTASASPYNLALGNKSFTPTIQLNDGEITITGTGLINQIEGQGTVNITDSHSIHHLSLDAGSVLQLEEGTTQQIVESFSLAGSPGNLTEVRSSGPSTANLNIQFHKKICLDHLDIENVAVLGESTVSAGTNSNVVNASGWIEKSCNNILFADFTIQYNCQNAAIYFVDNSSGPITGRAWDFGEPASAKNTSSLENPIHRYNEGGDHNVTLEVTDGAESAEYSQQVSQNPSLLAENKVELSNGKLISFLPADSYQWVLNGELINGAVSRSLDLTHGLGEYAVLTFDETCNRQSDVFLITGVNDDFTEPVRPIAYPNPAESNLFIGSPDGTKIRVITIVDRLGKIIHKEEAFEDLVEMNIAATPAGIYILQIKTERGTFTDKVSIR